MNSKTATKAQVHKLADKLNVTVDDESDAYSIYITLTTPKGIRFKGTGSHSAVTSFDRAQPGEESNKYFGKMPEAWGHCLEDLKLGVEECDNPNCGFCERGLMNE